MEVEMPGKSMSSMYLGREQCYRNSKTLSLHKSNEWVAVRISSVEARKLNKSLKHQGIFYQRGRKKKVGERGKKTAAKLCLMEFLAF